MWKLIPAVLGAGAIGVVLAIYSVREISHRQNHAAHVATVAAKTAVKTATKAAAKTAAKKVKTAQEKLNDALVASQIKACKRGNILRRTVNKDTVVIQVFMRLAAAQYAKVKTPFAQQRAAGYLAGAAQLRLVPLPNCGSVIVRPPDVTQPEGKP